MLIKDAKYNDGQCFVGNGCVEHIKVHVDDKGVGNLWHYEARVISDNLSRDCRNLKKLE